jgi:hypothetical protein
MRPSKHNPSIDIVRSEALFVSACQPSDHPSLGQVQEAISQAVRQFGIRGCTERVAQEFGDHPDIAGARMRWARQAVAEAFTTPSPVRSVTGTGQRSWFVTMRMRTRTRREVSP